MLKNALFRGGLNAETLETLLSSDPECNKEDTPAPNRAPWDDGTHTKPAHVPVFVSAPKETGPSPDLSDRTTVGNGIHGRPQPSSRVHSFAQTDSSVDASGDKDDEQPSSSYHGVPKQDQRTILITNLAERTTHKDLVGIIRGGRLLDIYIRNDKSATVSFVEGAHEFLSYAKRNDLYLHSKRVSIHKRQSSFFTDQRQLEVRWNERQFHVPHHVSNKIGIGATRNLVIRGAAEKLTEVQIRNHLDHIHNLVVIDVRFERGDVFISTNSIHNALFARTCMMSRTAYKGLRIDWYPDECALPLPTPVNSRPSASAPPPSQKKPVATINRYDLLNMDGTDASSDGEDPALYDGVPITDWTEVNT